MKAWSHISRMLPECRFKEDLRIIFHKWMAKRWPVSIKKLELLGDGGLSLELGNGLKFISEMHSRWEVLGILHEQLVDHIYTKLYELKRGDTVVDAGAHIGVFTVLAAKSVGSDGKVIAIEPEKKNLGSLRKNIELNGLNNVTVVPAGLWDRRTRKRLYLSRSSVGHSLVHGSDKPEEIEVDTLDNILKKLGVGKVDFIKMNIEGAEIQALRGMKKTLKSSDVKLAIEAHHLVNGIPTYRIIVPWLERAGFDVHEEGGIVHTKKSPHVLFVYWGPHPVHTEFVKEINADLYPVLWRKSNSFVKRLLGMGFTSLILPRGYDVYLSEGCFVATTLAKKLHLIKGKLVNMCADAQLYNIVFNIWKGYRKEITLKLMGEMDGFVCVGGYEANLLSKLTDKPYVVVEPFILNYEKFSRMKPDLESHNILCVANGPSWYLRGMDLLMDAFELAKREIGDLSLTVAGWKWNPKKVPDGVKFVGWHSDLRPFIERAALYIQLDRGAAFTVSVLEAMCSGLPVIVSEEMGVKKILGSHSVAPPDAPEIADRIVRYLKLSATERSRLSKEVRSIATKYGRGRKLPEFKRQFNRLMEALA